MPAQAIGQLTGDLHTVLTAAASAPLADRAFLRITGPDATRWLNGMVTNSVQALNPGDGNYNFLLNAQGRIQGDCTIYREPFTSEPAFLLETDIAQAEIIQQLLDRFIIMDDVELTPGLAFGNAPPSDPVHGVALLGPHAATLLPKLLLPKLPTANGDLSTLGSSSAGTLTPATFEGHEVLVLTSSPSVPAFELWAQDAALIQSLYRDLDKLAVPQATPATLEALRILQARPRYGVDIRNTETARDLPQETNQAHALHFAKGCYLGQEIVERIRSRGQVHRLLTPFRLEGSLPATFPAPLQVNGKPAGELTSAASLDTTEGPVLLALGYGRREFLDTQALFTYGGGTAHPRRAGDLT